MAHVSISSCWVEMICSSVHVGIVYSTMFYELTREQSWVDLGSAVVTLEASIYASRISKSNEFLVVRLMLIIQSFVWRQQTEYWLIGECIWSDEGVLIFDNRHCDCNHSGRGVQRVVRYGLKVSHSALIAFPFN
jgi:hypothetical protein